MSLEIKVKDRKAKIEVLEQKGSVYRVKIDDKEYELDVEKVEEGGYSVIYEGKSVNMDLMEEDAANKYHVNTGNENFDVEIIDAASKYRTTTGGELEGGDNFISSPMPGKVAKILVEEGDKVEKGDTVIIISAMKMESEYKSMFAGVIKKIFVNEGDTTEAHASLIEITPDE
jgi:biotin carboxyl carrier protein